MSWLPMWSWFKRSSATSTDPDPKPTKNNRDRVYANNSNTSSQTISKERDLISRTKINETKQLLLSIKDLATTLESLPLDDLLAKTEPQPIKQDTVEQTTEISNNATTTAPATELAEESLSEEDAISDQVSQESETLTIGSDESPESDHSSQSSSSKSPGRGLVRGTGVSVSQHGDMIWDERRGWVSRTGHEDVLQVDLLDTHAPSTPPLSADLPQDFVLHLNTDRLAHEHAQLGAWMQRSAEPDRSYLHLIRTMSIMKMVREVETVRRMMSDGDSDEDEWRVRARVNNAAQNSAASGPDKPTARVMSDKLRQFVDAREEEDDIVLPDKPLKLVQQSPVPESAFPSELTVELDTKPRNGHAPGPASEAKNKVKRGKGLKLVPAQATFSDELVFDDEPQSSAASNRGSASGKKDLSAFVDEDEQPVKAVKSKPSKMKLITLDSLPSAHNKPSAALPSLASAAVQSASDAAQDEELFDDIELPSAADLKRRIKALRPNANNTSAGLLVKRQSSGKIDSGALEDWCEDEDDDAPLSSAPSKKSAVNNARGVNLLTVK